MFEWQETGITRLYGRFVRNFNFRDVVEVILLFGKVAVSILNLLLIRVGFLLVFLELFVMICLVLCF